MNRVSEIGLKKPISARQIAIYSGLAVMFLLALALRASFYRIQTSDYTVFVSQWYDYIHNHGGFAALKDNFSNYNPPYLYLLAITTYLPVSKLVAIKTISVVFDVVLSIFTYLLIRLKYSRSYAAIIGSLVLLFVPTIFINSSAWGQCDAIYAAFCLGSLYFLLKERFAWACVFFGLAFAFKLQAVFFLPVLLVLCLKRKELLKYLVLIPIIFLLMLAPALIAGRDAGSLLTVYVSQASTGGVGNGGQFAGGRTGQFPSGGPRQFPKSGTGSSASGRTGQFPGGQGRQFGNGGAGRFRGGGNQGGSSSSLTLNAPSFYQWLPANAAGYWKWVGIFLAGLFVVGVGGLVLWSKRALTSGVIVKIALVFALAIPFLLPEMHERYFYLADVISIVYAFYFPRYFFVALIMQACSLLSYAPYLQGSQIVSLAYVAGAVLVITVITVADLVLTLYPDIGRASVQGQVGI